MSLLLSQISGGGSSVNYTDSLLGASYVISNKSLTDSVARADSLSTAAYVVSAKNITDSKAITDNLSVAAYVRSGISITDSVARNDALSKASYVITANDLNDVVTGIVVAYADNLSTASYTFTGNQLNDSITRAAIDTTGWIFVQKGKKKKKPKPELIITEVAPPPRRGTITLSQMFGKQAAEMMQPIDITANIKYRLNKKRLKQEEELMMMF